MTEVWKNIPGYKGRYQASTLGNIRKGAGKVLRQSSYETRGGKYYRKCSFAGKTQLAHRVIAITFIPNPDSKPQIDHIDYDEQNNRVDNLRWATAKENHSHSICRMKHKRIGENHPKSVLSNERRINIKKLREEGLSYKQIAQLYGVNIKTIYAITYRIRDFGECDYRAFREGLR